jgi:CBS domain-containing protein
MKYRPPGETFHEVGRLFPGEVVPATVTPETTVGEALTVMQTHRYSQLPVIADGELRGVFSLWSLARLVVQSQGKVDPLTIPVEDAMDWIPAVTVHDSLHGVMTLLEEHEALAVMAPQGVQAIATSIDVLRYFYRVAKPYVLIQEIELAIRGLISACVQGVELERCIRFALASKYERQTDRRPVPSRLEEMTFEDLRTIITAKDNWPLFEGVLGRNRLLVASKLEAIRELRNKVFHFRDDLSVTDFQNLVAERTWLLDKTRHLVLRPEVASG